MNTRSGTKYAGNCRMIEIGSKGLPFRLVFNVDHIDSIRFEELIEERTIRTAGGVGVAAVMNDAGEIITPAVPPPTHTEPVQVGWTVIITSGGAANGINFPNMEAAMGCYNSIINMIQAVGVPHVFMGPLRPPPKPEAPAGLLDATGKVIADAVDAADLHPGLAAGDGVGIAENDDDGELHEEVDFGLTDEDMALLENPEFDETIEEEIEEQALKNTLEDPPAEH